MAGALYYLNADFDLSLRARPRALQRRAVQKAAEAMSVCGLLRGGAGDAVLVRAGVPDEFLRYLDRMGFSPPRLIRLPGTDRGLRLSPYGWSGEAIAMNREQARPAPHPPLDLLRKVNSRAFSANLEAEHFPGEARGLVFTSVEQLQKWLARAGGRKEGWVVKADHGNAGVGNRRLRQRRLDAEDLRFVEGLLAEDDRAALEPWRSRVSDLCGVFSLERSGAAGPLRIHETVCTRDGAFIGAVFGGDVGRDLRVSMERTAGILAGELGRLGYFGPVCFDAFVYREDGKERLRPLADLNCREPVSDAVYRFWSTRWTDRVLLWRFFTASRLKSGAIERIVASGGHFDSARRRGVLPVSPWKIDLGAGFTRAPRTAVAFVGRSRAEVTSLEASFRARWERR